MAKDTSTSIIAAYAHAAEAGDPYAKVIMAWEYVRNEHDSKDVQMSLELLRSAENEIPRIARLNIARLMLLERMDGAADVVKRDADDEFPPAMYMTALIEINSETPNKDIYIQYLRKAAAKGHLPSQILLFSKQKMSIRKMTKYPYYIWLTLKMAIVKYKDYFNPAILN